MPVHGAIAAALLAAAAVPSLAQAPAAPATPADTPELPRYTIDPTHTAVTFEAVHRGVSISRGRWTRTEGDIAFDRAAGRGRVAIAIQIGSLSTGSKAFDAWLLGPAAFDAAQHPTARFEATDFAFDAAARKPVRIAGTLTVRGQGHPVTLTTTLFDCYTSPLFRREVCGGDFEAEIDPRRWLPAAALAAAAVPERVKLLVQIEGVRQ